MGAVALAWRPPHRSVVILVLCIVCVSSGRSSGSISPESASDQELNLPGPFSPYCLQEAIDLHGAGDSMEIRARLVRLTATCGDMRVNTSSAAYPHKPTASVVKLDKENATAPQAPVPARQRQHISLEQFQKAILETTTPPPPPKDEPRPVPKPQEPVDVFNYASADCGAKVLAHSEDSQNSFSVLVSNPDRYMLAPCSSEKWLVIELCEELNLHTIKIGNFEKFSSTFNEFEVLACDHYPVPPRSSEWIPLGTFHAANVLTDQTFRVDRGEVWARFIQFRFLTHHGTEFYCPVSSIRIFGATLMQDFKKGLIDSETELSKITESIENRKQGTKPVDVHTSPAPAPTPTPAPTPAPASVSTSASSPPPSESKVTANATAPVETPPLVSEKNATSEADRVASAKAESATSQPPPKPTKGNDTAADSPASAPAASGTPQKASTSTAAVDSNVTSTTVAPNTTSTGNATGAPQTVNATASAYLNISATAEVIVEGDEDGKSKRMTAESIFKMLTNKVKSLQINQSLANHYLESLKDHYNLLFDDMRADVDRLEAGFAILNGTQPTAVVQASAAKKQLKCQKEVAIAALDMADRMYALEQRTAEQLDAMRRQMWIIQRERDQSYTVSVVAIGISIVALLSAGLLIVLAQSPKVPGTPKPVPLADIADVKPSFPRLAPAAAAVRRPSPKTTITPPDETRGAEGLGVSIKAEIKPEPPWPDNADKSKPTIAGHAQRSMARAKSERSLHTRVPHFDDKPPVVYPAASPEATPPRHGVPLPVTSPSPSPGSKLRLAGNAYYALHKGDDT